MEDNRVNRFMGGSPLAVLVRLILLSILVGVILAAFGINPANIVQRLTGLLRGVWNMGWDTVLWVWQYFLLGAAIVIPLWLIMRLVRAPRGR